jgi:hypothetical protein
MFTKIAARVLRLLIFVALALFVPMSVSDCLSSPGKKASHEKKEKKDNSKIDKSMGFDENKDEDEDGDHDGKTGPWGCYPCEKGGDRYADNFINFHRGPAVDENRGRPFDALGAPDVRPPDTKGLVSLGIGGQITLVFKNNYIVDGPGIDFVVYEGTFFGEPVEKAEFFVAQKPGGPFVPIRPVRVKGRDIFEFQFDLAGTGLRCARLLRIVDDGDKSSGGNGFDVDAAKAVHSCAHWHPGDWPDENGDERHDKGDENGDERHGRGDER